MKSRKILALLLSLAMTAAFLTGCGGGNRPEESNAPTPESAHADAPSDAPAPESQSVTVTDMTGREITLEEPATRIVALTAADCEIIYALGAGDTLVGRGEYCDWPEEALKVPVVQSGADTNMEQIIALKPQVLLMGTMAQTKEQIASLENAGVHVVVSSAQDVAGVYDAISITGALLGKAQEAQALIDDMKRAFDEVSKTASDYAGKTVYFEVSPLEYGLWAAGSDTFMNEIAEMMGLDNIFSDVTGWGEVSEEQVIERAPDYIVTIAMFFGDGPTPEEEIASRPGWANIPAVANGAILNLQNDELSRPGPRLADGARILSDFLKAA